MGKNYDFNTADTLYTCNNAYADVFQTDFG